MHLCSEETNRVREGKGREANRNQNRENERRGRDGGDLTLLRIHPRQIERERLLLPCPQTERTHESDAEMDGNHKELGEKRRDSYLEKRVAGEEPLRGCGGRRRCGSGGSARRLTSSSRGRQWCDGADGKEAGVEGGSGGGRGPWPRW